MHLKFNNCIILNDVVVCYNGSKSRSYLHNVLLFYGKTIFVSLTFSEKLHFLLAGLQFYATKTSEIIFSEKQIESECLHFGLNIHYIPLFLVCATKLCQSISDRIWINDVRSRGEGLTNFS